ncbi:MAG: hypothetical protein V4521_00525 [Pseudomonadota bacterium]
MRSQFDTLFCTNWVNDGECRLLGLGAEDVELITRAAMDMLEG